MKKGVKIFIIILGAICALIAAQAVWHAALPGIEYSDGHYIVDGKQYEFDNSFRVNKKGAVVGKLADTGESVYKVKDDPDGLFLYVREKPFHMKRAPMARTDADKLFTQAITSIRLGRTEKASTSDNEVIRQIAEAHLSTENRVAFGKEPQYSLYAVSEAYPAAEMGFTVFKRDGSYYVETQIDENGRRMAAPLGAEASAWLESVIG